MAEANGGRREDETLTMEEVWWAGKVLPGDRYLSNPNFQLIWGRQAFLPGV